MVKKEFEFCPLCGGQVFTEDPEREVKSRFDVILKCSCCGFESNIDKTFTLTRECEEDGSVKIQYINFPVTYYIPK